MTTLTLVEPVDYGEEIRKSRFLAQAAPVDSIEGALAFIGERSTLAASHHCWAYRVGTSYRFNDDGEPGGSAGRPILAAIDGQGVDRIAVVVTRWFGGIKLGVGGLARAYGGCAAECLRRAAKREHVERVRVRVDCDFACAAQLRARLHEFEAVKHAESTTESGVELQLDVPRPQLAPLCDYLRDLTRGRGRVRLPP